MRLFVLGCLLCSAIVLLATAAPPHPAAVPFSKDGSDGMTIYECPDWLQEYITFHNVNRAKPDAKYLVYACKSEKHWCGGLGDRIRGIKFALQVAYATNRIFLIDDHKPVPLESILAPNLLNWTLAGLPLAALPSTDVFWYSNEQPNRLALDYTPFTGPTRVAYLFTNFDDDQRLPPNATALRRIHPEVVGDAALSTGMYFDRITLTSTSCMMRVLFRASDLVLADHRAKLLELYNATDPTYVAMHFRCGGMGKMGEEERIPRTHNNLVAFVNGLSCARHLARKHHITAPVLVLTDNKALRQSIIDGHFGGGVITTAPQAAHIDFLPEKERDADWVQEAARSVYVDLLLLTGAGCIVAPTRSGFVNIARGWAAPECVATGKDHCLHQQLHDALRTVFNLPPKW